MKQFQTTIEVSTHGAGLYEITRQAERFCTAAGQGLLTLFVRHTSASLTIQENADPDVQRDLNEFFRRLAPENAPWYRHVLEGADDMPAHIKAALTDVSLSIPVANGRPVLGTWQGIYLFEHRARPHSRQVIAHLLSD